MESSTVDKLPFTTLLEKDVWGEGSIGFRYDGWRVYNYNMVQRG